MSPDMQRTVRVRFAPSPTGHLHIGSLRAALFNWLFARHHGGIFLLRIEDTDTQRSKQEYTDAILSSLQWAGITADEPVVIQTDRRAQHQQVIDRLIEQGKAYRCFCSPDDVIARLEKKTDENFFVQYDGYCRYRVYPEDEYTNPHVIRFALPTDRTQVTFNDLVRGPVTIGMDQLDDFIISRSDGSPMYNFVVVVDDHDMRISHVIRGEDHISNTPKQILLYEACGYPVPLFAHVPLILGPSGDRLSKRDGATSVTEYRTAGYLPDALINYLARLGWSHGDQEIFSVEQLVALFTLDGVGKKGSIFDMQKLDWVNSVHIKGRSADQLIAYIVETLNPDFVQQYSNWSLEQLQQVVDLYKERVATVRELQDEIGLVYRGSEHIDKDARERWLSPEVIGHLEQVINKLNTLDTWSVEMVTSTIKGIGKQHGIKLVNLLQPLRLALLGKDSGPGVFQLIVLIGRDESVNRIRRLLTS